MVPKARVGHTITIINDKAYLIGGINKQEVMDDIWCLCLKTLTWTKISTHGEINNNTPKRYGHSAILQSPNSILLFGGFKIEYTDQLKSSKDMYKLTFIYDDKNNLTC